jgi:hypothetical protein
MENKRLRSSQPRQAAGRWQTVCPNGTKKQNLKKL